MKEKYFTLLLILIISISGCRNGTNSKVRCYYVSPSGDDNNSGTIKKPWRTLEKINSTDINPGSKILLEGGEVFNGTVHLDSLDSGIEGGIVTIDSYGNGRATVDAANAAGIVIDNCKYFAIKNLEIKGSGRKRGNTADGVYITRSGFFKVDSLELSGFQHSGLHINTCSDARITHIIAKDNGFAGIHVTGTVSNDPVIYDNNNIYIGYCVASDNPGDPTVKNNHSGNGILASSVKVGTIEYCEAFNNGWDMPWTGNGPVGIWIWDCTDFKIQHCISHDNKTNPKAADGGGFDLDGGVSNSVIQYCLSYNNMGAGYGLFEFGAAKPWENNIVRYNISQDDGSLNGGSVAIWRSSDSSAMKNCEIYNNTFYNTTGRGFSLMILNNAPGFRFLNNIFVYKGAFLMPGQKLVSELFQSNCYWNLSNDQRIAGYKNTQEWAMSSGNEKRGNVYIGIYADPALRNPGHCSVTDPVKLDTLNLAGYELKQGSLLINHGLDLLKLFTLDPGKIDIAGTSLPLDEGFDIGAMEFIKHN